MQEKLDAKFSSAIESLRNRAASLSDKVRSSVGLLIQDIQQRVEQEPAETVNPAATKIIESMSDANTDFAEKFSDFYANASEENKKKILDDLVGNDGEERMSGSLSTFFLRNRESTPDDSDNTPFILQNSPSKLLH